MEYMVQVLALAGNEVVALLGSGGLLMEYLG